MQQAAAIASKRWPLALIALAVVGSYGGWWTWQRTQAANRPEVVLDGTIEATEIDISAPRAGRLKKYRVQEGDQVAENAVVAELEAPDVIEQFQRAENVLAAARARVRDLEAALPAEDAAASSQLRQAEANAEGTRKAALLAGQALERRPALRATLDQAVSQQGIAERAVQQAKAAVEGAEAARASAAREFETSLQLKQALASAEAQVKTLGAALDSAQARRDQLAQGPRDEEKAAAAAQVEQADAAVDEANSALAYAREQLKDLSELAERGAIARSKVREAQARVDSATTKVRQADPARSQAAAKLQALERGATAEELRGADAAVRQAREALQGAEQARDNAKAAWDLKLAATAQLKNAEAQLKLAQAQRGSAVAAFEGARKAVRNAQAAFDAALVEQQNANLAIQQSRAAASQLEAARAQEALRRKTAGRSPQLEQARASGVQARAAFDLAREQKEALSVRSPIAGRLDRTMVDEGELVSPGATLARVVPLKDLMVVAYLPGSQQARLREGDPVTVKVGEIQKDGVVVQISDTPEFTPGTVQMADEKAQLVYQVRIRVHGSDDRLKPGMAARVEKHSAPAKSPPPGP
jgi:multidrug resistance efflux pump